ncbi:hypothetical protein ABFS82_14G031800 [Erythranthe guttata]|uniref:Uncharacterized protein n=1 Tax=Erythranthe guttata TaxID=4155 RepID=A0A022QYH0_ERYGU|nr:PREDICTED: uncharacterized protein LOC105963092 [Erythranthe guttata]EYU32619.1 hypothetical protein MIMGU_mgv1a016237mg [Erythranthe guttata]|eukprot:XP_012842914.1 PREDICTED: uncharacterized protein LOC105963092 [Erythranthe guttata]
MAFFRVTSKSISTGKILLNGDQWICRGFVSVTRLSQKAKIDKETCGKIIEAAETVKDGTKEVVQEVKRVGEVVAGRVANTTGNMVADVAKKGFEKASENAESEKSKDVLDTAKAASEAFKEKTEKNDNK